LTLIGIKLTIICFVASVMQLPIENNTQHNVMIPEILDPIKRILDLVSAQCHVVKGYKYCASAVVCCYW
jgi:hypothetical protein